MEVRSYEVTLELLDIDPDDLEEVANKLYEAGCDDGTVFATNGIAYIVFDREAVSGFDAILSTLVDVKKAGYDARFIEDKGR